MVVLRRPTCGTFLNNFSFLEKVFWDKTIQKFNPVSSKTSIKLFIKLSYFKISFFPVQSFTIKSTYWLFTSV